MRFGVVLALALGVAGCNLGGFGGAVVQSQPVELVTILPATVFAYIDATSDVPVTEDNQLKYKLRAKKLLQIVVDGARYDPRKDPRFRTGAERINIGSESALNGRIDIEIENPESVPAGQEGVYEEGKSAESDTAPWGRITQFTPAAVEVKDTTGHPGEIKTYGRRRILKVTFEETDFSVGKTITGTIKVTFERADGDPADAATGTLELAFSAPVINEIIGECSGSLNCDRWLLEAQTP